MKDSSGGGCGVGVAVTLAMFLILFLAVQVKDLQKRVTNLEAAQHQKAQP